MSSPGQYADRMMRPGGGRVLTTSRPCFAPLCNGSVAIVVDVPRAPYQTFAAVGAACDSCGHTGTYSVRMSGDWSRIESVALVPSP